MVSPGVAELVRNQTEAEPKSARKIDRPDGSAIAVPLNHFRRPSMAEEKTLNDLFLDTLKDIYYAKSRS